MLFRMPTVRKIPYVWEMWRDQDEERQVKKKKEANKVCYVGEKLCQEQTLISCFKARV